jgi:phage baseplate assembly protein W
MTQKGLYKGYSSFEYQRRKTFKLRDLDLVKMDLLNHIFTKKGERVMMPNFGTMIPEMTFEPLDDETVSTVREEVVRVVNYDPRVELINIDVTPDYDTNSISVAVNLFYIELGTSDIMELNIEFTS